ncbi:hypothetical protein EVAR_71348_1 [Eumeta japonica]|uniref:Uncharacterized protein n=1 Tax=Eumeta variegata TaxID=151549 RepID=A0A4C2ACT6_EUMVA|nr:hypothetical protein EVAR_71348_1 [Eumeta japonica]
MRHLEHVIRDTGEGQRGQRWGPTASQYPVRTASASAVGSRRDVNELEFCPVIGFRDDAVRPPLSAARALCYGQDQIAETGQRTESIIRVRQSSRVAAWLAGAALSRWRGTSAGRRRVLPQALQLSVK